MHVFFCFFFQNSLSSFESHLIPDQLIDPYQTTFHGPKIFIYSYIQVHFRLDFLMEANNMTPDQTALKAAV